jgi:hypothetical protein
VFMAKSSKRDKNDPALAAGRPIPFARDSSHFVHIENSLATVLRQIRALNGLRSTVLWVSCRLNRSETGDIPVFAGWFESVEAREIRIRRGFPYSPIQIRFGDTHSSSLYRECLRQPPRKVVKRKWGADSADSTSQRLGENYYGETHRRSVPIKINRRSVGTLNAAFLGNPAAKDTGIEKILFRWAQYSNSDLVKYIKDKLHYSEYSAK